MIAGFLPKFIREPLKKVYFFLVGLFYTPSRFSKYQNRFLLVSGCEDIDLRNQYLKGNLMKIKKPVARYCDQLLDLISSKAVAKEPYAIIRASDGEAYFLRGQLVGNAPTRHFTKGGLPSGAYLDLFKDGFLRCDLRLGEMYRSNRRAFKKIYGRDVFSEIPFECLYALMANRKLLTIKQKMGIIGPDNKLEIIKNLLRFPAYQEYIGRVGFDDYIAVPERGTANDVVSLAESVTSRLRPEIDVYLVGIGIAKLAVMHRLAAASPAVFVDIGAGLSALAGAVGRERQYFAGWTNFRLKDFDYSKVDMMDATIDNKTFFL